MKKRIERTNALLKKQVEEELLVLKKNNESMMSGYSQNPEKRKAFPPDVHVQLFTRQNGYCAYEECKEKMTWNDFEIDHLIPISLGGGHESTNLRLMHPDCNRKKSNTITVSQGDLNAYLKGKINKDFN